jgi:hypothetical protein
MNLARQLPHSKEPEITNPPVLATKIFIWLPYFQMKFRSLTKRDDGGRKTLGTAIVFEGNTSEPKPEAALSV